jgi:hypothetical protein
MRTTVAAAHRRRRVAALTVLAILIAGGVALAAGAGGNSRRAASSGRTSQSTGAASDSAARAPTQGPPPPPVAHLIVAPVHTAGAWRVVARVHGLPGAWVAEQAGVTLMRFDQARVHLNLHAGSSDGGTVGWRYGDAVTPREIHLLVAAFNGGFKLTYPNVGFTSGGHVAAALKSGLGSIVTYTDGTTAIGAWHAGVPSARRTVYSVLQNQYLLIDRGRPSPSAAGCILGCFGATVGSRTVVARSGLGITESGQLVWAAGNSLTPTGLARAMIAAGAVRAVELDINPDWVAAYLYPHHRGGPLPVPVIPGQRGIGGALLAPYSRDFFTVVAD